MQEARTASSLHHPNICTVFDVGEDRGEAWIAMEFVAGETLSALMGRGPLPAEIVVRFGIQIADALDHAHARGIAHRDLKPANVILGADGRLKVLDFGIAARLPEDTAAAAARTTEPAAGWTGRLAGTLAYMSPEALRGEAPGAAADLWALGVVLYELVSGRHPFSGASAPDVIAAILTGPAAPLPPSVPPALAAAIERLLQKDPARRFRSAGEVRAVLEGIAEPATRFAASADAPAPASNLVRSRSKSALAWTAAAIVIGAVSFSVWWLSRARPLVLRDHQLLTTLAQVNRSPSLSPDGSLMAYVAPDAQGVRQIWVRDFTEGKPVQITSGKVPASRPRWSPANDQIVFARDGQGLWSVAPLGGTPNRLVERGSNPSLSDGGTRLVYEHQREIWSAESDGSSPRRIEGVPTQYYAVDRRPAISPDGKWIAFFRAEAGPNGDLWVVSAAGGEARQLTFDIREGGSPVWTPDSRRIIFSSARAGSQTLWQMPATGGDPQPLTTGTGEDDEPEISRDGRKLVYVNVKRLWTLLMRDTPSAAPRTLLERYTGVLFPIFSPTGDRIVFFGRQDRAVAISTIRTDGSDLRQLTGGTELNHQPVWSADGTNVYFFQSRPTVSFRRVSADGGPSEEALPWNWEAQNAPRFDPSGHRMAYVRLGADAATLIRDAASGVERALPKPAIHRPSWSPDSRSIAGWRLPSTVVVCSVDGGRCDDVAQGIHARFGPGGSTIWFLKPVPGAATYQLWSIDLATRREQPFGEIGPFRLIDRHFDISARGALVWAPMIEGRPELWATRVGK
jgi:Tol biopolymer transport system component